MQIFRHAWGLPSLHPMGAHQLLLTLLSRLKPMLSPYQIRMKVRVTTVGASLGPVILATALRSTVT